LLKTSIFFNFWDFIWTWASHLIKLWVKDGLRLSFKNSGMDLDIPQNDSPLTSGGQNILCTGTEMARAAKVFLAARFHRAAAARY